MQTYRVHYERPIFQASTLGTRVVGFRPWWGQVQAESPEQAVQEWHRRHGTFAPLVHEHCRLLHVEPLAPQA